MVPNSRIIGAIGATVAVAYGSVAAISFYAAIVGLPAIAPTERLRQGERLSTSETQRALGASYHAAKIFEPGRYYTDAALAASTLSSAERQAVGISASGEELIDAALAARPASPHNWVRRALAQLSRGDTAGARRSLEASMTVGRVVPGLTIPRLRIVLALLKRQPDAELEGYFDQQARIAAAIEPQALAVFADGGAAEGRTQRALFTDFKLFSAYLNALNLHRQDVAATRKRG